MSGTALGFDYVDEDGTFSVLARVTALDGTGDEYVPGEGNVLLQDDITSITCKVFDLGTNRNNESGTEITPAPTVTVADNVFDTLQTVGWPTTQDSHGYNFRHDVSATFTADPNEWRLLEYKFTLDSGAVVWLEQRVKIRPKQTG